MNQRISKALIKPIADRPFVEGQRLGTRLFLSPQFESIFNGNCDVSLFRNKNLALEFLSLLKDAVTKSGLNPQVLSNQKYQTPKAIDQLVKYLRISTNANAKTKLVQGLIFSRANKELLKT